MTLADVLVDLGVDVRRSDEREITGRCPVHLRRTGKDDRSPSWSMNSTSGLWICFSCGARGTLSTLVEELTGSTDALISTHKLLIDKGLERLSSVDSHYVEPEVDWIQFGRFSRVPDKVLALRKIDPDTAWTYGIRWDRDTRAYVIPIVSPLGELKGWQTKSLSKVRNQPEGIKKSDYLFGSDKFSSRYAILVESPLDVVRLASVFDTPQGLATFGASVSLAQMRMLSEIAEGVIVAMDNDPAGISSARRLFKDLPSFRRGIKFLNYKGIDKKDIGEMSAKEIAKAIGTASVVPPSLDV
jgi:DNA primase